MFFLLCKKAENVFSFVRGWDDGWVAVDTDVLILILTPKVRSGLHIWKQQLSRHHSVLCSFLSTVPHLTEDGEEFLAEHADGRSSGAWQRAAERGKSCWAWRSEAGCVCCQGRGTQKHYGNRRVFLASSTAGGRGTGFGHQAEPSRGRGSSSGAGNLVSCP